MIIIKKIIILIFNDYVLVTLWILNIIFAIKSCNWVLALAFFLIALLTAGHIITRRVLKNSELIKTITNKKRVTCIKCKKRFQNVPMIEVDYKGKDGVSCFNCYLRYRID